MYWITPDGNYYVGMDVAGGSIPVTERPGGPEYKWAGGIDGEWILDVAYAGNLKNELLAVARESREIALNRLTGHRLDEEDALKVAVAANNPTAIAFREANIVAIKQCRQRLKDIMQDPRVLAAFNGEVKDVMKVVYAEIVAELAAAAPSVLIAFRGLDAL